ncbi:MAG: hypothetical protein NUW01_17075, partial [Gemmatimonadaceae bacterium]|nr:hypothetical protein [Gemmatimonadaceae bacterium]
MVKVEATHGNLLSADVALAAVALIDIGAVDLLDARSASPARPPASIRGTRNIGMRFVIETAALALCVPVALKVQPHVFKKYLSITRTVKSQILALRLGMTLSVAPLAFAFYLRVEFAVKSHVLPPTVVTP